MAKVNETECKAAGIDPKEIKRIADGLSRYAKAAKKLGVQVFGGSACGDLRYDDGGNGKLILAELDGDFDGGDGSAAHGDDGLLRGEF